MRCHYYFGCRFGGRCKERCADARPTDPVEAQAALRERMDWEREKISDSSESES